MGALVLTTYDWVPETPRGFVRDLRVRWALEERGCPIASRARRFASGAPGTLRTSRSARCRG